MRQREEPQVFPATLCAAGCGKPYEKWCRQCNLVYCKEHVDRQRHKCKPDEVRPYPSGRTTPKKGRADEKPPAPSRGPDLFPPQPNGNG